MFTHFDDTTDVETHFHVTSLRQRCDDMARRGVTFHIHKIELLPHWAEMILKVRGIEQPRLDRAMRTEDYYPLLHVIMPDNTILLVDGSHTYVARFRKGHREVYSYVVPQPIWEDYVMDGLPPSTREELLNSFSGIHIQQDTDK